MLMNILAAAVAAAASLAINFVWFTGLFARSYLDGLGKTQAQLDAGHSMAMASTA